ncbi:hypothetical protein CM240_0780 [Clostridium bornimense]|uniref:Uncharacterized protein n=1 Tax=Clostridium bornimense TaxID=1216932 RepID=W6SE90_9CLOT|nr:hypothetical protein [Clostridium bornimense]CDM67945.1 hypothetical protein CM240_0780 [Clostridium bornimense]
MENKKKYIIISSIGAIVIALAIIVVLVIVNNKESKIDISILNGLINEKYEITNSNIEERVLELNIESNNLDTDNLKNLGNSIATKIKDSGWKIRAVTINIFEDGKSNDDNKFYSEGLKNRINLSINVGDISISEFKKVESNNIDNIVIDDMNRRYHSIENNKLIIKLEAEDINEENAMTKMKEYIETFKSLNPNIGDKEIEVRVNEFYKVGFATSSDSDIMEISRTEKF